MKIIKVFPVAFMMLTAFISCQKQEDIFGGISVGTLKKTSGGDCLPITVNGIFKVDNELNNNSYVDVQVSVTNGGTFTISTDTINGYSFNRTGGVGTGLHTLRLYASGKPLAAGTNTFTVKYGTSVCTFSVVVSGGTSVPASYTLGGSPGTCTGFTLAGIYEAGTPLTSANTVTLSVNVTAVGAYTISTTSVNGIVFSASGQFTTTGPQNVTLTGSGTPAAAGTFPVSVNGSSSGCSFSLNCTSPGVYTLGGAGSNCTGVVLSGSYIAGIALTAANTAVIDVNVTVAGSYSISTTTVNGIKFTAAGSFTVTGSQTVTLTGSGMPTAAGAFNFPVTGAGSTCTLSVTVSPTPVSAYSLVCAGIVTNGTYYVGTALGASNTLSVSVNVTSIGTYTISSLPAVNGISFSKTGIFTSTGIQTITIPGTGTPAAAGAFSYTVTGAGNSCSVSITAVVGTPGILTCKIDGVFTSFSEDAYAELLFNVFGTTETDLNIKGRLLPVGTPSDTYLLAISKPGGGTIPAGTYNENTFVNSGGVYKVGMSYFINSTSVYWTASDNTPFSPNPPFTITITSITATNCTGTFSGTIRENFGLGTGSKLITEGVFNLPVK